MAEITQAQEDAIQRAYLLLGEHFDRMVFAVEWEPDDKVGGSCMQVLYKGSKWSCVGLAEGLVHELKFGRTGSPGNK